MSRTYSAPEVKPDHVPAFVVTKLEGTFKKTVHTKTDAGLVAKEVEVPCGWMVYFPKGHSIHVETEAEMHRLGFDAAIVPLVDPSGEADDGSKKLPSIPNVIHQEKRK